MSRYNFLETVTTNSMRFDKEKNLENNLDINKTKQVGKTRFYFTCVDCDFSDKFLIQNMKSNRVNYRCNICYLKLESIFYDMTKTTPFQKTYSIKTNKEKSSCYSYDWYRKIGETTLLVEILDANHLKLKESDIFKYKHVMDSPELKILYVAGCNFDKNLYQIQKDLLLESIEVLLASEDKFAFVLDNNQKFQKFFETKVFE